MRKFLKQKKKMNHGVWEYGLTFIVEEVILFHIKIIILTFYLDLLTCKKKKKRKMKKKFEKKGRTG